MYLYSTYKIALPLSYTAKILAEDIGFEPMITASKAVALDQAKLIPNKFMLLSFLLRPRKMHVRADQN